MNPEPPEERPPDEPIRCRHCGEVDPDDHQDGCPQVRAEEQAPDVHPEAQPGDGMIIEERDQCRNPGCTNPRDPDGDGFRRQFCSVQCEVKFDHLRDDARDARLSEEGDR